jgi:hypothetical protein
MILIPLILIGIFAYTYIKPTPEPPRPPDNRPTLTISVVETTSSSITFHIVSNEDLDELTDLNMRMYYDQISEDFPVIPVLNGFEFDYTLEDLEADTEYTELSVAYTYGVTGFVQSNRIDSMNTI